MSQIELLNKFDLSKKEVEMTIREINESLDNENPLLLLARLTAMEQIVAGVKDELKERILDEALKYPEKRFTVRGVTYEKKSRKSYDYKGCPVWDEAKVKVKKIEELMKTLSVPMADTDTGEIINPAKFTETEYLIVSLRND